MPVARNTANNATNPLAPRTTAICSRRRAIALSVSGWSVGIPTRRSSSAISRSSVVIVAGIALPLELPGPLSPPSLHRAVGGSDLSGDLVDDAVIAGQPRDPVVVGVAASLHIEDAQGGSAQGIWAPMPRAAMQMYTGVAGQRERPNRVEVCRFREIDVTRGDDDDRIAAHRHQRLRVRVVAIEQLTAQPSVN